MLNKFRFANVDAFSDGPGSHGDGCVLPFPRIHWRVSPQFSCSVSTSAANFSGSRSAQKESESFFAGLKVNSRPRIRPPDQRPRRFILGSDPQFFPDSLHVAEDGREHQVAVVSTVPIPCRGASPQCGLPLVLSVHEPGGSNVHVEAAASWTSV